MKMDFDSVLINILDIFWEGKAVEIEEYYQRYPEHQEKLFAKLRIADFLKNNLSEKDVGQGREFGEYIILQELGRGKTGIVFLAIQPSLSRLVAIKILSPDFALDKKALGVFREEAKIIAKFSHPNIIPVYYFGEEKGVYYIVMCYIPGPSLEDILTHLRRIKPGEKSTAGIIQEILRTSSLTKHDSMEQSISLRRSGSFWNKSYYELVAVIGAEIAEAVSYAHQNNIFHGNIKPSNILLTSDAIPIVEDFSLAKDIQKSSLNQSTELIETLIYTAPEKIKNSAINAKTDIWSLGVTLYELLTFTVPFWGRSLQEFMDKTQKASPLPLRTYNKKIPLELEAIVLKCLENQPENRYPSAGELASDLNSYLQSKPITAKPAGIYGKAYKWIKRNPLVSSWIVVALLLGIASSLLSFNKRINDYIEDGIFCIDNARWPQAVHNYTQALRLLHYTPFSENRRKEALKDLARGWRGQGNFQEAIRCLEEALAIDPQYPSARLYLGITYLDKGLYDKAIDCYQTAIVFAPKDRSNYLYLGEALTEKGLIDEAIESYLKAVTIAPEDIESYKKIVAVLHKKGLTGREKIKTYLENKKVISLQIETILNLLP